MNTQKIVAVERTQRGGYDSKNGYMYTQIVTLDNGDVGEVSSKQENRWKVGDECTVTNKTQNQYGTRISLSKPNAGGYSQYESNPSRQNEINVSWAINCAIELGRKTPEEIKKTALNMLKLREQIKKEANDLADVVDDPKPSELEENKPPF